MKRKNKIVASILCAMILASCLATPAWAETPSLEIPSAVPNQDLKVTREITQQLPLSEKNMVQHEQKITTYQDGSQIIDTTKVYDCPNMNSAKASWMTRKGQHSAQRKNSNGKVLCEITVYCTFRYDSAAQLVERVDYSKNIWFHPDLTDATVKNFHFSIDTGGGGLGWLPWAYVRGNYSVGYGYTTNSGWVEVKCDSGGYIEGKSKILV